MHSIDDRRLNELNAQLESLQQRQGEQQATAEQLWRELEQAREHDLNAEAKAMYTEGRKPKPKAPGVERALENAMHDLDILARAVAMAQSDLAQYLSKHHGDLGRKLREARSERAEAVSALAAPLLAALRAYFAVGDDERILEPYTRVAEENHSNEPQDMTLIWGPYTTQNVLGPDRIGGLARVQLEGVLGALVALPEAELGEAGVTIVGDAPSEEDEETVASLGPPPSEEETEADTVVAGSLAAATSEATTTIVGPSSGDLEADEEDVERILGPPPGGAGTFR